ncbi:MAG TPA: hypothetical protein VJQ50_00090, partial [Terriglobales bacterium]|nr:hypothetical protein [Terriglobales bacterium]
AKFKATRAFWLIALALAFLLVWYLWGPAGTPPGQPPLTSLSQENFEQLARDFNSASGGPRLVLLLSPT